MDDAATHICPSRQGKGSIKLASQAVLEPPVATAPAVAPPAPPSSTPKHGSTPKPKPRPIINPWVIALTVTLATFMELLDTSIANVSLPYIAGGLGRSYDEVTWILTTYLVANAVVLPMSAWLSRVFGRKNYYMACVALFTITSFFCGIAPSLNIMLLARVLQGIGGGGLAPVEQAILVDTFPPAKRASAFALYTVAIVTAPAIGPVLGGWITDNYNWRWVFLINIPIGLLSLFLTNRFVHDPDSYAEERKTVRSIDSNGKPGKLKVDGIGIALIGLGSAALEVLLDRGQIDDWFGSSFIIWMFVIGIGCLTTAIFWELRHPDPVIDFHMLKVRNFAIANVFYFVFGFGLFASTTMIPQLLQSLYGYRAIDAGLVLGPGALVITFLAPVGAQLVQRGLIKPRILLFGAVMVVGIAFLHFSHFDLDTDYKHYAWARALQGLGYAFFFVPLSVIAYSQLSPAQNNKASSLTNFFRNWGGSFGIAFITTVSERRQNFHQSRVGSNIAASSPALQQNIHQTADYLQTHGWAPTDALSAAYARVYEQLHAQTQLLAFMDCFHIIGIITLIAAPLVLLTKNFKPAGKSTTAH
jgi:DHA2 family multidrug resistance protein